MTSSNDYYNATASSYSELHYPEQIEKLTSIWEHIKKHISIHEKILDVGCGTGISTEFFAKKGFTIKGIDPAIQLLQNKVSKLDLQIALAENIPFTNNSFDIVISLTAIQNFTDIPKGLAEIKRVGKEKFILTFLAEKEREQELHKLVLKQFPKATHFKERDNIYIIGFT